jgi:hypothetical protein
MSTLIGSDYLFSSDVASLLFPTERFELYEERPGPKFTLTLRSS